jgi:hypothetical protein
MSSSVKSKNSLKFKKAPMCELLHDQEAEFFTCQDGKWIFVSLEAPEKISDYHFEIEQFLKSPSATIDWLAHLSEKPWFDANDFMEMVHRFREATDSYGAL